MFFQIKNAGSVGRGATLRQHVARCGRPKRKSLNIISHLCDIVFSNFTYTYSVLYLVTLYILYVNYLFIKILVYLFKLLFKLVCAQKQC